MSALQMGLWVLWGLVGVVALLHWKLNDDECSLLDVLACVLIGALMGPLPPILKALHSVKIRG